VTGLLFASLGSSRSSAATAPPTVVPDLPENAAELRDLEASGAIENVRVVAPAPAVPSASRSQNPLAADMARLLDAEKTSLAALKTRFDAAPDEASALEVEREIETVKADGEISLLRLQAEYARRDGKPQAAREIEAAIEAALQLRTKPASAANPTSGAAPRGPRR
jgi:hypothetical protein